MCIRDRYERLKNVYIKEENKDSKIEYPNCKDYNKNVKFEGTFNEKELKKTKTHVGYMNVVPGNVFTIEPGIYFIETLIKSAKADENKNKYIDFDLVDKYTVSSLLFLI